jgi:invasion protein IalB
MGNCAEAYGDEPIAQREQARASMTFARWLFAQLLLGAVLLGDSGPAAAQPASPFPAPPQQTSATYDDWIVRCETRPGPPLQKTCEMLQFTQIKGQTSVLTQIAIGHPQKGRPIPLVIQVPVGAWLPAGVRITAGGKDEGLSVEFKLCTPSACVARIEIKDDVIRKFRAATEQGKLQFKDSQQRDVALPISFKGFGTAYEALLKE